MLRVKPLGEKNPTQIKTTKTKNKTLLGNQIKGSITDSQIRLRLPISQED